LSQAYGSRDRNWVLYENTSWQPTDSVKNPVSLVNFDDDLEKFKHHSFQQILIFEVNYNGNF